MAPEDVGKGWGNGIGKGWGNGIEKGRSQCRYVMEQVTSVRGSVVPTLQEDQDHPGGREGVLVHQFSSADVGLTSLALPAQPTHWQSSLLRLQTKTLRKHWQEELVMPKENTASTPAADRSEHPSTHHVLLAICCARPSASGWA